MTQHRTDKSVAPLPPKHLPPRRGTRLSRGLAAAGVLVSISWAVGLSVAALKPGNESILCLVSLVPPQLVLAVLAYAARDRAVGAGLTLLSALLFGSWSWSIVGGDIQFGCLTIPFIWVGVAVMFPASRIRRVW